MMTRSNQQRIVNGGKIFAAEEQRIVAWLQICPLRWGHSQILYMIGYQTTILLAQELKLDLDIRLQAAEGQEATLCADTSEGAIVVQFNQPVVIESFIGLLP